jgi:hypothetical protein
VTKAETRRYSGQNKDANEYVCLGWELKFATLAFNSGYNNLLHYLYLDLIGRATQVYSRPVYAEVQNIEPKK